MKRAFRIIVPVILAIALVAGTVWYFLEYDPAFTKELLLTQARSFEDRGRYKLSAFLYDLAYRQSSQEDLVAIELAEQYLSIGNYTKAEYTLSQAIAANPSAELYAALCGVYVQQDKLLDAVNMLDTVTDPIIRAELGAQRPAAPALTPDPGFYSTYLTVEFDEAPGKLYLSADGDYPSIHEDLCTEPLTLSTGETVIYAVRIGENGLVSPLVINGYTIGGVIEEVEFSDEAIGAALRAMLEVGEETEIYTDMLWDIGDFAVPEEAKSYEDLAYLPYLKSLTIGSGSTGDLSVLAALTRLESLTIRGIRLSAEDLEAITSHTTLTALSLADCSLSSVAGFEKLTNLAVLDLSNNTLRNLSPLSGLTLMRELYLGNNAVTALDDLSAMNALEVLDISYNTVSSLSPIFAAKGTLRELYAGNNQLENILGIGDLKKLEVLDLSHNSLSDVKMLTSLTSLIQLNLSNNAIPSIAGLETMKSLRILNVAYNQIAELPAFQKECELVSIDLSHNQVASLEPLKGLPWLNTVSADYNPELDSLKPLDSCPVLIKVNAYGTKVTEVSFLTAKSIIVNFDPTLDK